MSEIERIHKMVEAGTITDAEAERLLSVLKEIDEAEGELDATGEAMETEARLAAGATAPSPAPTQRPAPTQPPAPADPPADAENAAGAASAASGAAAAGSEAAAGSAQPATEAAPQGTRWVHVSLLAGDVTLRADPDVREVVLEGDTDDVQLERTDDGFSVKHTMAGRNGSWVERFVSRIRSGDLLVRVPEGYGVDLNVTAGDVDLEGVPYLRGQLTSGDLDAQGLRGIDFRTAAGDLDLQMTLTEGKHQVRATAGDVRVRLGSDSDVAIDGAVSIGSAKVSVPGAESNHRGLGQRFEGTVGAGAARLALHVTTGDVKVEVGA